MHYLDYSEQIQHRTGDFPLAYYPVDQRHPRYRMPMHWHREAELIRIREGALSLYIDDQTLPARAGDLVLIGEGALHGGEPEDCVYECAVFDAALLQGVGACKRGLNGLTGHSLYLPGPVIAGDEALARAVEQLFTRCETGVEGNALGVMGALYEVFAALAARHGDARMDRGSGRFARKAAQLKPALEYIETHYGQGITLDALARRAGMSPKYFCRFFKAITHRSPIDYVNCYRMECASHFLAATDMTVAEVAQHCGFNDSSFFIKQYRRYKGVTPGSARGRA